MRPYIPDGCQLELYPVIFCFDLGQTLLYTPLLILLMCKFHKYISFQVKALLVVFLIALAMRPALIYACEVQQTNSYRCLQFLWLNDLTFYILFYYVVFKMLVLVIAMDYWKDGADTEPAMP